MESNASPTEDIAQAVTTPDDTACMLMFKLPGTPLPQLEDVPEEDEIAVKEKRESRQIRHTKSFPSARHFSRVFPAGTNTDAAASDPTLPALGATPNDVPSEMQRRLSRRVSNNRGPVESWEDGVDFCYEHAMDDEPYEWDAEIEEGGKDSQETTPQGNTAEEDPHSSIPDLHADSTKSAASSSVTVPGIITPSEPSGSPQVLTVPRDSNGSTVFTLSPSLLIPREYSTRLTHEESYHHSLTGPEAKTNFTFYGSFDHDILRNYSPRSSGGSPLSKQTSRDSLSVSRSGSSATRATTHRQSSSIDSVPELVGGKSVSLEKLPELGPGEHLDVDAIRQNLIKAADNIPIEQLEAATPPSGTPVKAQAQSPTARSRSNSDSAGRMLGGPFPVPQTDVITKLQRPTPRMRSSSLAHNGTTVRPKGHRTSYSLFPQTGMR